MSATHASGTPEVHRREGDEEDEEQRKRKSEMEQGACKKTNLKQNKPPKPNSKKTRQASGDDSSDESSDEACQDSGKRSPGRARDETRGRAMYEPPSTPPISSQRKRRDSSPRESTYDAAKAIPDERASYLSDSSPPKSPRVGHSASPTTGQHALRSPENKGRGSSSEAAQKSSIAVKQFDLPWPTNAEGADACRADGGDGGDGGGGGSLGRARGRRVIDSGHDIRCSGLQATRSSSSSGTRVWEQPSERKRRRHQSASCVEDLPPPPVDICEQLERSLPPEEYGKLNLLRWILAQPNNNTRRRRVRSTSHADSRAGPPRPSLRRGRAATLSDLNIQGEGMKRTSVRHHQGVDQAEPQIKPQSPSKARTKTQLRAQIQEQQLGAEAVPPPSEVQLEIQGRAVTQLQRRRTVQHVVTQAAAAAVKTTEPPLSSEGTKGETATEREQSPEDQEADSQVFIYLFRYNLASIGSDGMLYVLENPRNGKVPLPSFPVTEEHVATYQRFAQSYQAFNKDGRTSSSSASGDEATETNQPLQSSSSGGTDNTGPGIPLSPNPGEESDEGKKTGTSSKHQTPVQSSSSNGLPPVHPSSSAGSSSFPGGPHPLPPIGQSQAVHGQSSKETAAASSTSPVHSTFPALPSSPSVPPPSSDSNPPLPPPTSQSALSTDDSSSPPHPHQNEPPSHSTSEESD